MRLNWPISRSLLTLVRTCSEARHLIPWIEDAGWHMSYFGDTQSFLLKISSFSDEVELDHMTASRIEELVAHGADLHSYLESLRVPGRRPGLDVRLLYRLTDSSFLPAFLAAHPELFSFAFSASATEPLGGTAAAAGGGGGGGGALAEGAERGGGGGGWGQCSRVHDGAGWRDHSSVVVSACEVVGLREGGGVGWGGVGAGTEAGAWDRERGRMMLTRVQLQGPCDIPARFWPPIAPCFLPHSSASLHWLPPLPPPTPSKDTPSVDADKADTVHNFLKSTLYSDFLYSMH